METKMETNRRTKPVQIKDVAYYHLVEVKNKINSSSFTDTIEFLYHYWKEKDLIETKDKLESNKAKIAEMKAKLGKV